MDAQRDVGARLPPGLAALSQRERDLLLYLGEDEDGPGPPAGREVFEALASLGLIRLKRRNRIVFTAEGEEACDSLRKAR